MAVVLYWQLAVQKVVNVWLCKLDKGFGKPYRLLKTEDFSSVFALRKQQSLSWLQVFRAKNDLDCPRLGLVVGKKIAKRANRRNYMKRLIREWFRCHKSDLLAYDYVVRVRRCFTHEQYQEVQQELQVLLLRKK